MLGELNENQMKGGQGEIEIIDIEGVSYARKRMRPEYLADTEAIHRFLREISIAKESNSPNIIKIIDYGEDENGPFYIMPWYKQNLQAYIQKNKPVLFRDPEVQKIIFLSILNGVNELHSKGIIHRDLKPSNILIRNLDDIVVCDFGFSKKIDSSSSITDTGNWLGTPHYMSPEQQKDSKHVDERTDIYALGMILNDLTGRMESGSPDQLCRVADKATSFNKESRYNSVSDLMKAVISGYKIWVREKHGFEISDILDDIGSGKLDEIELVKDVEIVLDSRNYSPGNADTLAAMLNEGQYQMLENEYEDLCLEMFEHVWDDWYDTWKTNDYGRIDDMTSFVSYYWSISDSPKVKGFNIAKLIDLAIKGNRYPAMEAIVDMMTDVSGDIELQKTLMDHISGYKIKDSYKKINKTPPSWL